MCTVLSEAKELYMSNLGSRELMKDNNCLNKYLQYQISEGTETTWKNELTEAQFNKTESKSLGVFDLIHNVSMIASNYGDYSDYKKLFSIRDMYLKGSDFFEYCLYFEKVLGSISHLISSNMDRNLKLELIYEFEKMLTDIISDTGNIPDKSFYDITDKYGMDHKPNYVNDKIADIYNTVRAIESGITSPNKG